METARPLHTALRIALVVVVLACISVGILWALLMRDLRQMDFGKIPIYKEGVGPGFEDATDGGTN